MNCFFVVFMFVLLLMGFVFVMGDVLFVFVDQFVLVQEFLVIFVLDVLESLFGDLEVGIEDFMCNMLCEVQLYLDNFGNDLGGMVSLLGLVLFEIGMMIDDVCNYQVFEMLENGDIIICCRVDVLLCFEMGLNLCQMMWLNLDILWGLVFDQDVFDQNVFVCDLVSEIEF